MNLVIFGATGNLYADKLGKALYLLFLGKKLPEQFTIIAFGRRDMSNENFRAFTKENILKRGKIDVSKLNDFLSHVEYFQGDFTNTEDFIKLKDFISNASSFKDGRLIFHIATASQLYEKIFENLKISGLSGVSQHAGILIEKPFGKDESDAKRLEEILAGMFKKENIFHIDHYLAKETAQNILSFRFRDGATEHWNDENIKKIKVIFHESNVVGSRGASYDSVGAFLDVGQNHMLELLAVSIMDKPGSFDAGDIHSSRAKVLSSLSVDVSEKITKGQYAGYLSEPGVDPHSKTETFFRIFLRSKDPKFSHAQFELEAGKGLVDLRSPVTSTTVAIEIYFKNQSKKELKIQPVPGTVYESYTKVYNDAIIGDQSFFVSIQEIMLEWKLTEELFKKWKDVPLSIYKKGTSPESIT